MVYYNQFTIEQLTELCNLLRVAWEKHALNVIEQKTGNWSICSKDFYGEILNKYEFLPDQQGNWTVLRCSGKHATREKNAMEQSHLCFGMEVSEIIDDLGNPGAYLVYLGRAVSLRSLQEHQFVAICKLMEDLITFDKDGVKVKIDRPSLDIVIRHFYPQMSNEELMAFRMIHEKALFMTLKQACNIVRLLPDITKREFRKMTEDVIQEVRTEHRRAYADMLYVRCEIL